MTDSFLHPNYAIRPNTYDAMAKQLERDLRRQCPTPTWNVLKADDLDHFHAVDSFTFIVVCTLTVNDRRWKHHAKVGRDALVLDGNMAIHTLICQAQIDLGKWIFESHAVDVGQLGDSS